MFFLLVGWHWTSPHRYFIYSIALPNPCQYLKTLLCQMWGPFPPSIPPPRVILTWELHVKVSCHSDLDTRRRRRRCSWKSERSSFGHLIGLYDFHFLSFLKKKMFFFLDLKGKKRCNECFLNNFFSFPYIFYPFFLGSRLGRSSLFHHSNFGAGMERRKRKWNIQTRKKLPWIGFILTPVACLVSFNGRGTEVKGSSIDKYRG